MTELPILWADDAFVAVYKPAGIMVHRTEQAPDDQVLMTLLRDQLGRRVWPVHRLDRPTAGVMVFALSGAHSGALSKAFQERRVYKTYLAVVRGWPPEAGTIDHALAPTRDAEPKEAITDYQRLATTTVPVPIGRFPEARYALVKAMPRTGRYHQIRKHFHHISYHLVGDTAHGDGRHNRLFRDHFDWHRLCLLATQLSFDHPYTGEFITLKTEGDDDWQNLLKRLFPNGPPWEITVGGE